VFIALHKNRYDFSKISDLANHRVVSWQNAVEMIGGDYADMAKNNDRYTEVANQATQLKVLYERNAIIQLDWSIFLYHKGILREDKSLDTAKLIDVFRLLKKNDCQYLFKDKKTQEAFNQNFGKIKSSGMYDKILKKYIGSHE
jgi:polar amino acid transport system substrate-binding protein